VGLLSIPLGQIAAWTVWPWLTWTLGVIALFAQVPFASIPLETMPSIFVAAYYAGLIGLTWYLRRPREQRPAMIKKLVTPRRAILIGGLTVVLLAVALSWRADSRFCWMSMGIRHSCRRRAANRFSSNGQCNLPFSATFRLADQFIGTHVGADTAEGVVR
jgi:hypothetical protein